VSAAVLAAASAAVLTAALAASMARAAAPDDPRRLPLDPKQVLGHEACEKCHASEVATWKKTPHSTTFVTLHQKKEATDIAKKLGLSSIKRGQVCIECHYTPQANDEAAQAKAISGVSCESCHGAAQKWVKLHADYGGPTATKAQESEARHEVKGRDEHDHPRSSASRWDWDIVGPDE